MMLLDEPTAGMTHEDVERIVALVKRVAANRTVLLVEHNLSVVPALCDRITVLARARCWPRATTRGAAKDPRVVEAPISGPPMPMPPVTAADAHGRDLEAWYGGATSCTAWARGARGRGRHAARPQRRRQDDDAALDHGHRRQAHGLDPLPGPGD
jgi:ATPase subunit of ABC transporter with duplicated ATPase domains